MSDDLIIGLWGNLPPSTLDVFLRSLRATGYVGDVCILGFRISRESAGLLRAHDVMLHSALPYLREGLDVQTGRYFMYLDFIAKNASRYRHVMLTDTKDVAFQANPFPAVRDSAIVFASERLNIEDCAVNSSWIESAFGSKTLKSLSKKRISCSGTTIGKTDSVLEYLSKMASLISDKPSVRGIKGVDQGLHNFVVHAAPPERSELDLAESRIATLHYVPDTSIAINDDGILVDGVLSAIVHQWDRKPTLVQYLTSKYSNQDASDHKPSSSVESDRRVSRDAVLVYWQEGFAESSLRMFCFTLRSSGFFGSLVILTGGSIDILEELKRDFDVSVHEDKSIKESGLDRHVACHFHAKNWIAANEFDRLFFFDTPDAWFVSSPFAGMRRGLTVYAEGNKTISSSPLNTKWLLTFSSQSDLGLEKEIVSSSLVSGDKDEVLRFYSDLFSLAFLSNARADVGQSIQGAFNAIVHEIHGGRRSVTVSPNGSVAFFSIWNEDVDITSWPSLRVNDYTPSIVMHPGRNMQATPIISQVVGPQRMSIDVGGW